MGRASLQLRFMSLYRTNPVEGWVDRPGLSARAVWPCWCRWDGRSLQRPQETFEKSEGHPAPCGKVPAGQVNSRFSRTVASTSSLRAVFFCRQRRTLQPFPAGHRCKTSRPYAEVHFQQGLPVTSDLGGGKFADRQLSIDDQESRR